MTNQFLAASLLRAAIIPVIIACGLTMGGCSKDTQARKLTPPGDVDWDAINAQAEAENAASSTTEE
ncbi:hypothetical protein CA13_58680 [Planctomycetes bacterium CA13]|uniref:Uncharacterized protein n=1 Tax=Novipirellula herctigrandis TaxID=2527986 RepID=A0A5C5ZB11_9BACT|nr:hypothetical protein CA13_58680 [Planctomycetes bacterium CA13]